MFSFARITAAVSMRVADYYTQGRRSFFRLHEKGGRYNVVPAYHSALAGVLLAAAGVRMALGGCAGSAVAQYDVLKPQDRFQVYPVAKDPRGICICQDKDYLDVYRRKYR